MKLTHSCIVTEDVRRLRDFYAKVLRLAPQDYGEDYVEFPTDRGTLAVFARRAQDRLAPGSAKVSANRSVLLEFEVADVDAEYERLQPLGVEWVKPPTTQPWGNRSVYFRDPDGNLVNFYTRVARTLRAAMPPSRSSAGTPGAGPPVAAERDGMGPIEF